MQRNGTIMWGSEGKWWDQIILEDAVLIDRARIDVITMYPPGRYPGFIQMQFLCGEWHYDWLSMQGIK